MKKITSFLFLISFLLSCKKESNNTDSQEVFTDPRDGQEYPFKQIGSQVWMTKNINYNSVGSRCYNDDPANCVTYGRLYDWTSAITVAPPGWHLPSNSEWLTLINYLGGESVAGGKMKANNGGWETPNAGATNSSGFDGLPSGALDGFGSRSLGRIGYWWTATESGDRAISQQVNYDFTGTYMGETGKQLWISVRCVKN